MKKILSILPAPSASVILFVVICYLTLTPQPLPPSVLPSFFGWDKVAHFLMFGIWTMFLISDVGRLRAKRGSRLTPLGAGAVISAVATISGVIELLQGTSLINRACDLPDFVANSLGAICLGTFCYIKLSSTLRKQD